MILAGFGVARSPAGKRCVLGSHYQLITALERVESGLLSCTELDIGRSKMAEGARIRLSSFPPAGSSCYNAHRFSGCSGSSGDDVQPRS